MENIDQRIKNVETLVAKTSDQVGELKLVMESKATNKALKSLRTQIMERLDAIGAQLINLGE